MNSSAARTGIKTHRHRSGHTGQGPSYTKLLKNMALLGGGSYSAANSFDDLVSQIRGVFNQIQVTDASFASVMVPIRVNVRGSFLNQVKMGRFRPSTSPRWPGNLKLYQLAPDSNGNVWMVDNGGNLKVENQTTGFIVDEATRFGTNPSTFWNYRCVDATGTPLPYSTDLVSLCGNPGSGSDSPDGPVVEKGAARQRLRNAFSGNASNSGR